MGSSPQPGLPVLSLPADPGSAARLSPGLHLRFLPLQPHFPSPKSRANKTLRFYAICSYDCFPCILLLLALSWYKEENEAEGHWPAKWGGWGVLKGPKHALPPTCPLSPQQMPSCPVGQWGWCWFQAPGQGLFPIPETADKAPTWALISAGIQPGYSVPGRPLPAGPSTFQAPGGPPQPGHLSRGLSRSPRSPRF